MLTIRSEQMAALRQARFDTGYRRLRDELKPEFQTLADSGVAREGYDAWFDRTLAACGGWGLLRPGNVDSVLRYSLAYYPDFPNGSRFAGCRQILEDPGLDEQDKTDKVNHRLLYVR